ncbi:MAG: DUF4831 family protein [Porphyromonas sp.]|nr:DUF4831 family protein [Porphyromonas sp.]
MKRYHIYTLLALLTAFAQMASAQKVELYSVGALNDNRLVYALPTTMISIAVTSDVIKEEPGPLSLYAERFLGTQDAVMEPAERYRLKEVSIFPQGIADEEQRYAIEFKRNSEATNVALTPDGILVGINIEEVEAIAQPTDVLPDPNGWDLSFDAAFPLEYIQATTAAAKARILADNIYRIRENRDLVISGESEQPFADGEALQFAVHRLDQQERAYVRQFNGIKASQTAVQVVDRLSPTETGQRVVARFSEQLGLLPADDLRGEPIYLDIKIIEQAAVLDEKEQQRLERRLKKGIVYRIPGSVRASVIYKGQTWSTRQLPVAQLGSLEALDMVLFNTKGKTTVVEIYPTNGGLKSVREADQ